MHHDRPDTETHPICTAPGTPLSATLYVRADVSKPCRRQIETVQSRLKTLSDTSLVAESQLRQWPPQHPSTQSGDGTVRMREALVAEFNRWANKHGYSLKPALRQRTVPATPISADRSYTEICVPIMLLTLTDAARQQTHLQGVVPYTVTDGSDEATTYTVYDWLTAAEEATGLADTQQKSLPDDWFTTAPPSESQSVQFPASSDG